MTTAADIAALQTAMSALATAANVAVIDLTKLAKAQADLAAAQVQVATLTTQNASLTASNVAQAGQITDLTTRLAGATAALVLAQVDANRWRRARVPDPTTYDQFFKAGGITSVSLSGADADATIDQDMAGTLPAGSFLGMYLISPTSKP